MCRLGGHGSLSAAVFSPATEMPCLGSHDTTCGPCGSWADREVICSQGILYLEHTAWISPVVITCCLRQWLCNQHFGYAHRLWHCVLFTVLVLCKCPLWQCFPLRIVGPCPKSQQNNLIGYHVNLRTGCAAFLSGQGAVRGTVGLLAFS